MALFLEKNKLCEISAEDVFFLLAELEEKAFYTCAEIKAMGGRFLQKSLRRGPSFGFSTEDTLAKLYKKSMDFVNATGHDAVERGTGDKIEVKSYTAASGACLGRSGNYGQERKAPTKEEFRAECLTKDYVFADHVHFIKTGILRYIRLEGSQFSEGSHKLKSQKHYKEIFENNSQNPIHVVRKQGPRLSKGKKVRK